MKSFWVGVFIGICITSGLVITAQIHMNDIKDLQDYNTELHQIVNEQQMQYDLLETKIVYCVGCYELALEIKSIYGTPTKEILEQWEYSK